MMERLFELLHSGLLTMVKQAADVIRDDSTMSNEDKTSFKNGLKMYTFLLHWFLTLASKTPAAATKATAPVAAKGGVRVSVLCVYVCGYIIYGQKNKPLTTNNKKKTHTGSWQEKER